MKPTAIDISRLEKNGVTCFTSLYILMALCSNQGQVRQVDLWKAMGTSRARISSGVNALVHHGLVEDIVQASDRRRHLLRLTDKGLVLCVQTKLLDPITAKSFDQLP